MRQSSKKLALRGRAIFLPRGSWAGNCSAGLRYFFAQGQLAWSLVPPNRAISLPRGGWAENHSAQLRYFFASGKNSFSLVVKSAPGGWAIYLLSS